MRVHNLRNWELGALLWALDFGDDQQARHGLGLAKSLGYGRVRLSVRQWHVCSHSKWPADPFGPPLTGDADDRTQLVARFVEEMESLCRKAELGGWQDSVQIRELRASAHPLPHGSQDGRWMTVERPNEYVDAKKNGMVLPLASGARRQLGRVAPSSIPVGRPQLRQAQSGGGATLSAAPLPVPATEELRGEVLQFAGGELRIRLENGEILKVIIDMRVFTEQAWGKPRLNGNDFPKGRKVVVRRGGGRVSFVEPG